MIKKLVFVIALALCAGNLFAQTCPAPISCYEAEYECCFVTPSVTTLTYGTTYTFLMTPMYACTPSGWKEWTCPSYCAPTIFVKNTGVNNGIIVASMDGVSIGTTIPYGTTWTHTTANTWTCPTGCLSANQGEITFTLQFTQHGGSGNVPITIGISSLAGYNEFGGTPGNPLPFSWSTTVTN